MKIRLLIVTLCLMLISICASAQEEYVVKFNNLIQTFGEEESFSDRYTTATWDEVQEYVDAGIVEYYEPVMYAEYLGVQNWQLDNINAAFPAKIGALGNDVKVGVVDGGMTVYNSIADHVLPGYDFYSDTTDVTDESGHGTFVSSMIALEGSGAAYESYIVPLKVFFHAVDENGNLIYDSKGQPVFTAKSDEVAEAIYAAVDTYGCSVINLSLSFSTSPQVVENAINHAINKGAIVVAAAGNDGTDNFHYPAAYDNVIGVGSVDNENVISYFSQRNESVFVVAPGEAVVTSPNSETNNVGSGTSFSAPQVSALAAIARCIDADITYAEFMELLKTTSTDLGDKDYDTSYGYGLINCEELIKKMIEDRSIYISPVKIKDGKANAIIYNNTAGALSFKNLFTCRDEEFVCQTQDVFLEADAVTTASYDYNDGKVKFMAWDGFAKLIPLSPISEK